jgi:hypothetical protein
MFHADHSAAAVTAHILVAVLSIGAGAVDAASRVRSRQHGEHFAGLGVPFPWLAPFTGHGLQSRAGAMVLIDWPADKGAPILIAEPAPTGAIP